MKANAQWVKRFVANGSSIFYDRHTGRIVRESIIGDVISENDIWSNSDFNPQAPLKVYFDMSYSGRILNSPILLLSLRATEGSEAISHARRLTRDCFAAGWRLAMTNQVNLK